MSSYIPPDGKFRVQDGPDASIALAQVMAEGREAEFWAGWSNADEAQFQADMARIDAKIKSEARRGKVEEQEQRTDA